MMASKSWPDNDQTAKKKEITMSTSLMNPSTDNELTLPTHDGLYYGGAWHAPVNNRYKDTYNPATAELLGRSADGGKDDVNAAVEGAERGFQQWRATPPLERARIMRRIADMIRSHAQELALLDSADGGNPVKEMTGDVMAAAAGWGFFAGLVTEMKGDSIP